jgi:hypothetical protein
MPAMARLPPRCTEHPDVELLCPACAGAAGGRQTSTRKADAARANLARARTTRWPKPKTRRRRP